MQNFHTPSLISERKEKEEKLRRISAEKAKIAAAENELQALKVSIRC